MARKPTESAGFLNPLVHSSEWPTALLPFFSFLFSPQMTGKASLNISVTLTVSHSPFVTCITSEPQMLYVQLERGQEQWARWGSLEKERVGTEKNYIYIYSIWHMPLSGAAYISVL